MHADQVPLVNDLTCTLLTQLRRNALRRVQHPIDAWQDSVTGLYASQVPWPLCSYATVSYACAQEHFEPLLKNPLMPVNALRLIARGLSNAVARGEAPPPTPADIRAALQADIEEAEVAELMSILGRGL